uniref:vascular endothelial growth factor A-like isoform X2 n=1 Tax=Myxine glutinosa TaxID=7769 RepID=UPI00358EB55F
MNALCLLYTLMHAVMTRSVLVLPSNGRHLSLTVIPFSKVLNGSMCRPREAMVSVGSEFPKEASAVFRPSCVPLQRCSGCCSDPVRECVPIAMTSITMQLYKTFPLHEGGYEELTFKEHSKCECRLKRGFHSQSSCQPCSDRRYTPDPVTCTCVCRLSSRRCHHHRQVLNLLACRCERPRR